MESNLAGSALALLVVLTAVSGAVVATTGTPIAVPGPGAQAQQEQQAQPGPPNTCPDGTELLAKYEWNKSVDNGSFVPEGSPNGVAISNVSTDDDGEPTSFNWTSDQEVEVVQVKGGLTVDQYPGGTSGFVDFGTSPAISNVIFCVSTETPTDTPTETPTDTPTETPTDTPTETTTTATTEEPDVVYWQVDFGAGERPPDPPSYWPNDLMAALGNSREGVTNNPSVLRQENESQLGAVVIVDKSFQFDDENDPTSVTVEFRLPEGADTRTLHLASFVLPGPFDEDEIDEQELFDVESITIEGGETASLTVSIPQPSTTSESIAWTPGVQLLGVGGGSVALLISRRRRID
ncbi:hypothetical protein [Halobaculum sp. EA56]|uniref:hypothetical protein n=1 Tax=Halobaculum sp. EA56 TaxID=3421648 RepID=UPI003EBE48CD